MQVMLRHTIGILSSCSGNVYGDGDILDLEGYEDLVLVVVLGATCQSEERNRRAMAPEVK